MQGQQGTIRDDRGSGPVGAAASARGLRHEDDRLAAASRLDGLGMEDPRVITLLRQRPTEVESLSRLQFYRHILADQ
eukprot:958060-Rhodomonas_salina.1